jgi:hypothetical protein
MPIASVLAGYLEWIKVRSRVAPWCDASYILAHVITGLVKICPCQHHQISKVEELEMQHLKVLVIRHAGTIVKETEEQNERKKNGTYNQFMGPENACSPWCSSFDAWLLHLCYQPRTSPVYCTVPHLYIVAFPWQRVP